MTLIHDQIFYNEVVHLDGSHFVGCTLVECVLEYHGGDVVFESTTLRHCRHVFFGHARQTVQYLQNIGLMEYDPASWSDDSQVVH